MHLFFKLSLVLFAISLSAEEPWAPEISKENLGGYDWIELQSGEWLKGEIKHMYNEELVFDSEILDDLTIDWDDIKQIKTQRTLSMQLDERIEVSGNIKMDGGTIEVPEATVVSSSLNIFDDKSDGRMATLRIRDWEIPFSFPIG